jgi:hypothetical protein
MKLGCESLISASLPWIGNPDRSDSQLSLRQDFMSSVCDHDVFAQITIFVILNGYADYFVFDDILLSSSAPNEKIKVCRKFKVIQDHARIAEMSDSDECGP